MGVYESGRSNPLGNQHKLYTHLANEKHDVSFEKTGGYGDFERAKKQVENESRRLKLARMKDVACSREYARKDYKPKKADSKNTVSLRNKCMKDRIAFDVDVVGRNDGSVGLKGIARCHSLGECPFCHISEARERADKIKDAVKRFERDGGGFVYFLTLTARHSFGDDLKSLRVALCKSWSFIFDHNSGKLAKQRLELEGTVRAFDATHGKNGWHPHLHCLLFMRKELTLKEERKLESWIFHRWSRCFPKFGFKEPTRDRAVVLERARKGEACAEYILKMGIGGELVGVFNKEARGENRTHWQILSDIEEYGRKSDGGLWDEWCLAIRGNRWLTTSRGLLERWSIQKEKPNEERLLAAYGGDEWDGHNRKWIADLLNSAKKHHAKTLDDWKIEEKERQERAKRTFERLIVKQQYKNAPGVIFIKPIDQVRLPFVFKPMHHIVDNYSRK